VDRSRSQGTFVSRAGPSPAERVGAPSASRGGPSSARRWARTDPATATNDDESRWVSPVVTSAGPAGAAARAQASGGSLRAGSPSRARRCRPSWCEVRSPRREPRGTRRPAADVVAVRAGAAAPRQGEPALGVVAPDRNESVLRTAPEWHHFSGLWHHNGAI